MQVTHRVIAEVPDRSRIDEVLAAMTSSLDEHAIVERFGGSGQVIEFRVRFASEAEVDGIVQRAHSDAMHVTSCEVQVI